MSKYKEIITDGNRIYEGLMNSIDKSKWKESSQNAALSFLNLIYDIQDDLERQQYSMSDETVFILHERGRVRRISSLQVRDRVVRHILCDDIFMPLIRNKIIYDNGASIEGRGLSFSKKRFETHLHRYVVHNESNNGYILFGDFSKFYDNIEHVTAKQQLLDLVDDDEYIQWLLDLIFENFEIDVTDMSSEEIDKIKHGIFNKLEYEPVSSLDATNSRSRKTIKKSINIGDQLAQLIGIYYPHRIDNYIKIVCSEKYYGRYMDDWYIINSDKEYLWDLLHDIEDIALDLGLYINRNKTRIVQLDKPFTYLQTRYRVTSTGKIYKKINPKRITAMRKRLKKLAIKVYNDEIDYYDVENMFKSWMGSFYKIMSRDQIRNLFVLYEELFNVMIYVDEGKIVIV